MSTIDCIILFVSNFCEVLVMEYRRLGNSEIIVSSVGIGMEHLNGTQRETVVSIVDEAVKNGINYFDMLLFSDADKENFAEAIRGKRDKLVLAWHLGLADTDGQYRRTRDVEECQRLFDDMLGRLGTDYIDILHLHNIDEAGDFDKVVEKGGVFELAQSLKNQGKVKLIGYSGHQPETAIKAVEGGYIDVIMHPLYIIGDEPGRQRLLHMCKGKGIGFIAMKAFAGGDIFKEDIPVTPVMCISYSLAQPGVCTVPIGVKSLEELSQALKYFEATDEEKDYNPYIQEFRKDLKGTCVYCSHCLPCPKVIDIAKIMRILETSKYNLAEGIKNEYHSLANKASDCIKCGACAKRCPFGVDILGNLKKAEEMFEVMQK
jgi:predicted aldo/keto reductase-like oxidoreductase